MKIVPVVGSQVAAIDLGDEVLAFSGLKGRWDRIPRPKPAGEKLTIGVEDELVTLVSDGELLYTFSAATGRFSRPGDAKPISGEELLEKMFGQSSRRDPGQANLGLLSSSAPVDMMGGGETTRTPPVEIGKLEADYRQARSELFAGAEGSEPQLLAAARKAFDARQRLHLAQAAELEQRLLRIRNVIQSRESRREDWIQQWAKQAKQGDNEAASNSAKLGLGSGVRPAAKPNNKPNSAAIMDALAAFRTPSSPSEWSAIFKYVEVQQRALERDVESSPDESASEVLSALRRFSESLMSEFEATLVKADLRLRQARLQVEAAKSRLQQTTKLLERQLAPESELELANLAYERAVLDLQEAENTRAGLESAR